LIMRYVRSVSMSVKINGNLTESLRASREICQGDPISPYLFLLCAEGLSCLLKSTGPVYLSRGVRVGVHAPWISHLLFADDCIVFSKASQRGGRETSRNSRNLQPGFRAVGEPREISGVF
jgi:hypothetical protein